MTTEDAKEDGKYRYYLFDLGTLLLERALDAKQERDRAETSTDRTFQEGRLMGFHEVVSLMQNQALAFDITLKSISLADVDPEKDLL